MTYLVTWSMEAYQQLVRLEAAAEDPARIRKAGEWLDYALRRIPLDLGESRAGTDRVWYGDVLGVWFRVDTDAGTVKVLDVGPSRRR